MLFMVGLLGFSLNYGKMDGKKRLSNIQPNFDATEIDGHIDATDYSSGYSYRTVTFNNKESGIEYQVTDYFLVGGEVNRSGEKVNPSWGKDKDFDKLTIRDKISGNFQEFRSEQLPSAIKQYFNDRYIKAINGKFNRKDKKIPRPAPRRKTPLQDNKYKFAYV